MFFFSEVWGLSLNLTLEKNVRTAFQRHLGMPTSSNLGILRSHLNSVDAQSWWEFSWSKVLSAPWPQPNCTLWAACIFSWRFCLGVQLQFYFHCHLKSVILWESFKKYLLSSPAIILTGEWPLFPSGWKRERKRQEEIDDFGVFQALGLWGGTPQNEKGRFFRLRNDIG